MKHVKTILNIATAWLVFQVCALIWLALKNLGII
nr:MAG TPA: hypothetical protein [Caudoviricetes sp.]